MYASHVESQQAGNGLGASQGDDGAAPDIIGMLCAALCAGINSGSSGGGGSNPSHVPSGGYGGGGGGGGAGGGANGADALEGLIQTEPTPANHFGR